MSNLNPLHAGGFRVDSLSPASDAAAAAARAGDADAASWLAAGADGASGSLHVNAHDAGLTLDRIEREFLAALCADPVR